MTIFLGSTALDPGGTRALLNPPVGFNSVRAVRLANTTTDTLILNNIHGNDQGQEYLLSLMQMVYKFANNTAVPFVQGLTISPTAVVAGLLVEFSSDPDNDFPGTYPYPMAVS